MLLAGYSDKDWREILQYVEKDDATGLETFLASRGLCWLERGSFTPYFQDAYQNTILSTTILRNPKPKILDAVVPKVPNVNEDCHWWIENRWNPIGRTPLNLSNDVGNDYATDLLLKHGADPFDDTVERPGPRIVAAREAWSSRVCAIVWITRQLMVWRDLASDLIGPWLYPVKEIVEGEYCTNRVEWKRRKIDV